ncbi:MAG: hypothetical protein ACYSW8_11030 [Planctomycetota bacterium]|jgi:hypothetical protein
MTERERELLYWAYPEERMRIDDCCYRLDGRWSLPVHVSNVLRRRESEAYKAHCYTVAYAMRNL